MMINDFKRGDTMRNYIIRRIVQIIPVLFIVSLFVFALVYVAGDPVALMLPEDATAEEKEILREALGLDKPFIVQYGNFVTELLQGNFGRSFRYGQEALPI